METQQIIKLPLTTQIGRLLMLSKITTNYPDRTLADAVLGGDLG